MAGAGESDSSVTMGLTTQKNELVKQFCIYDGSGRLTTVYTAARFARHGTPCTKVDYTYISPTSNLVEKMQETEDTWDSSYDI